MIIVGTIKNVYIYSYVLYSPYTTILQVQIIPESLLPITIAQNVILNIITREKYACRLTWKLP